MRLGKNRGFSLAETLVVTLTISVMMVLVIPAYEKTTEKSRTIEAYHVLGAIRSAQQRYLYDHGTFSSSLYGLDIPDPNSAARFFNFRSLRSASPANLVVRSPVSRNLKPFLGLAEKDPLMTHPSRRDIGSRKVSSHESIESCRTSAWLANSHSSPK